MKKLTALLLALTMAVTLTACAPQAKDPAAGDPSAPQTRTTFTVGFDAEFPPYGYQDDQGEYIGFDLSLAQEVATRNGWELVKKPISWDAKDMELDSGIIDCLWNGFTMTGREDQYTFSNPYVDNSQVVVVKSDSGIAAFADLAGKNMDVQADSSALAALGDPENQDAAAVAVALKKLQEVPDYETAFTDLETGIVDAIAVDVGVATYQIAQRGDGFTILEQPLATEQYGVGFKLGNTALRDAVQKTLDEMVADGTAAKIVAEWSAQGLNADSVLLGK